MTPSALNVEDFAEGKVRLMETKLGPRSPLLHIPLKDLRLPQSVLIAMIFRDHRMIIPHGNDVLLPLDNVYFLGNPETVAELPQNVGAANYQHRDREKKGDRRYDIKYREKFADFKRRDTKAGRTGHFRQSHR